MLTVSESAITKIQAILAEENNPNLKLRVFVQGGGCSGVRVLVDSMSGGYLQGAEVDYREDQYGSSFSIKNPQAVTTCGCGSSFSPE